MVQEVILHQETLQPELNYNQIRFSCYNPFMFDTLTYANKLKEAGFTDRQAETIATSQGQIINEQLVTREHFDFRIKELETKLDSRIKELELKQEARFKDMEGQMTLLRWMNGLILAGILSLIIKAFFTH